MSAYTALLYGATGAIGQDLVKILLNSDKWKKVIVVVRREIDDWKNHPNKSKLQVECLKDMDELLKPSKFKYEGIDCVFVLFGSQVKHGEETFVKVDKTYPLMAA
jgi:oxidoreductase